MPFPKFIAILQHLFFACTPGLTIKNPGKVEKGLNLQGCYSSPPDER
jgi:hypothetical protein